MKRLAWFTFVILATLTAIVLIWQIRIALVLFLLSLATAAAFRPAVTALTRRGFSPRIALILIYSAGLGLLAALLLLIGPFLLQDLQGLANDFAIGYQYILVEWAQGDILQQAIARQLPPLDELLGALFGQEGFVMFNTVFGLTSAFLEVMGQVVLILVLSVYWTADRVRFERLWLSIVPIERRMRAREIWRDIEENVGAYISSEAVQTLLAGLILGVGYKLIGLPYPVFLALVGAVAWLIPLIGIVLAVAPIILIAFFSSGGLTISAVGALYTVLVLMMLELAIEPRFFDRRRFSGFLLVLMMITLINALGLIGLLIAPPIALALQILLHHLLQEQIVSANGKPILELIDLEKRLAHMRTKMAESLEANPPQIINLMERVGYIISEAGQYTGTELAVDTPVTDGHSLKLSD